jgi:hypothetical protein
VDQSDPAIVGGDSSNASRVARWTGTLGIVLPAVGIIVYPIWSFPATQTPGSEVARWAATYHDRLVVTQVLNTVGVMLWLVFGCAVWAYLRSRLPAGSTLATGFAAGLVGFVTLILSGFTAFDLLLYRNRSAELSALLYDFTFGLLAMSGCPPPWHWRRSPSPCTSTGCCHGRPLTSQSSLPPDTYCSSPRSSRTTAPFRSKVSRSQGVSRFCCSPGSSEPHWRCHTMLSD